MKTSLQLPFLSLALAGFTAMIPAAQAQNMSTSGTFNVRAFGAKGDGKTIDSPAVDRAINAASAAGGGTVYFPAGTYASYTIHLKSNITLNIDSGATLLAADTVNGVGYDPPEPNAFDKYQDFGHSHFKNSLIYGEGLHDIAIIGQGMIWGKGLVRSGSQSRTAAQNAAIRGIKVDPQAAPYGYPSPGDAVEKGWGNKSISLKLCRNVIIRDTTILHGGHFAILATGVDNLTIDNLKIDTNRDGMDIDSCRNVRVSNCSVNSPNDDGICPKSDFALGFARATENMTITNCQVSGYDEGSFLDGTYKRTARGNPTGRIKMGTESNGGFKNITISNCLFDYCRGLALETVDGGLLEDVTISNITMRDITNAPIFLRLGARMRGPQGVPVGALRRIIISNVVVYNADARQGCLISGVPGHDIEDVRLSNIQLYYKGGGTAEQAARTVSDQITAYPEPSSFGDLPAYGFFVRNVTDFKMNDVEVSTLSPDQRPAFVFDDVKGADLIHVRAQQTPGVPSFKLNNVNGFSLQLSQQWSDKKLANAVNQSF